MTNREIIELNEIYSLDHNGLAVKLVDKNRNIYFLTKYNVIIVQWSSGKEIVVPGYWSLASRTQPKRIDSNPITIMNEKSKICFKTKIYFLHFILFIIKQNKY